MVGLEEQAGLLVAGNSVAVIYHSNAHSRAMGSGLDPEPVGPDRFSLESIRKRSQLLGGEAVITGLPDQGTLIRVDLPLTEHMPSDA